MIWSQFGPSWRIFRRFDPRWTQFSARIHIATGWQITCPARGRFRPFDCSLRFVKQETKTRVFPIHANATVEAVFEGCLASETTAVQGHQRHAGSPLAALPGRYSVRRAIPDNTPSTGESARCPLGGVVIVLPAGDAVLCNVDRGVSASRRTHARATPWYGGCHDGFYCHSRATQWKDEHLD